MITAFSQQQNNQYFLFLFATFLFSVDLICSSESSLLSQYHLQLIFFSIHSCTGKCYPPYQLSSFLRLLSYFREFDPRFLFIFFPQDSFLNFHYFPLMQIGVTFGSVTILYCYCMCPFHSSPLHVQWSKTSPDMLIFLHLSKSTLSLYVFLKTHFLVSFSYNHLLIRRIKVSQFEFLRKGWHLNTLP